MRTAYLRPISSYLLPALYSSKSLSLPFSRILFFLRTLLAGSPEDSTAHLYGPTVSPDGGGCVVPFCYRHPHPQYSAIAIRRLDQDWMRSHVSGRWSREWV